MDFDTSTLFGFFRGAKERQPFLCPRKFYCSKQCFSNITGRITIFSKIWSKTPRSIVWETLDESLVMAKEQKRDK